MSIFVLFLCLRSFCRAKLTRRSHREPRQRETFVWHNVGNLNITGIYRVRACVKIYLLSKKHYGLLTSFFFINSHNYSGDDQNYRAKSHHLQSADSCFGKFECLDFITLYKYCTLKNSTLKKMNEKNIS